MKRIASHAPINDIENEYIREVLKDYWVCCVSREASVLARKEVLSGKAKFGITGDGKEVPQVAMARAWEKGDFRSGYYRDQTLMFALGLSSVEEYFAQLYSDSENDAFSKGRQMNNHFASPLNKENGDWLKHTESFNVSADISSTAGQMARGLGLAYASKVYKEQVNLDQDRNFSNKGQEVCFCTIGDASTSEGVFWETINAACVVKVPLAVSVWDDGYGISVPIDFQTTKKNISKALKGFKLNDDKEGMHMYKAKAWDYAGLVEMYMTGIDQMRKDHIPALFHVEEVTQPQGHSTSGSHERYKSKERMQFETDKDCITVMQKWIVDNELASEELIEKLKTDAIKYTRKAKSRAWTNYSTRVEKDAKSGLKLIAEFEKTDTKGVLAELIAKLRGLIDPEGHEMVALIRRIHFTAVRSGIDGADLLKEWINEKVESTERKLSEFLYVEGANSALNVPVIRVKYDDKIELKSGHQILNKFFDLALEKYPELIAFGEDVGKIGDVNQGFAGLQDKYSDQRVFDTGIREWTIIGQAIGMSMRGLRPLAEIQYLDYLIYAMSALSDDLSTVRYRSGGIQQAPAIIRTRGHRLEGIWHGGSPMGLLINSLRGMHILVPRNMTIAAGFYNTLLQSKDPALVIESLNGYRLKERVPINLDEYTVSIGTPEVLQQGDQVTLVTYGSLVRIAEEAVNYLRENQEISVELIDVQSLLPFDIEKSIVESIKKTNRLLIVDEDLPGGASAYILQELLEGQNAYVYLDAAPVTLTAKDHRCPYGSEGDYFVKPNTEDIIDSVLKIVKE